MRWFTFVAAAIAFTIAAMKIFAHEPTMDEQLREMNGVPKPHESQSNAQDITADDPSPELADLQLGESLPANILKLEQAAQDKAKAMEEAALANAPAPNSKVDGAEISDTQAAEMRADLEKIIAREAAANGVTLDEGDLDQENLDQAGEIFDAEAKRKIDEMINGDPPELEVENDE